MIRTCWNGEPPGAPRKRGTRPGLRDENEPGGTCSCTRSGARLSHDPLRARNVAGSIITISRNRFNAIRSASPLVIATASPWTVS